MGLRNIFPLQKTRWGAGRGAAQHISVAKNNAKYVVLSWWGAGRGAAQHISIAKNNEKYVFLSWWGAGRGAAQHISAAKTMKICFFELMVCGAWGCATYFRCKKQ